MSTSNQSEHWRPDLLELAAGYAEDSVVVTTAQLDAPGPQFLYVNSAFTRMTGYSAAELLGKTPRILQGQETSREELDRLRDELSAGNDFIARVTNYRRDGSPFRMEWIISHLRNSDGETTHYVAIQRDITGRNLAEKELLARDQELRDANEQLLQTLRDLDLAERRAVYRERLAALGEMAAGVAHDLNNAFVPLTTGLELLNRFQNLSKKDHELIRSMQAAIQHGTKLVSNLQHFYRLKGEGERTSVDLHELVKAVREITRTKWKTQQLGLGTQIRFELDLSDVPSVTASETELRQVLVNLVFNAVDAMESGGVLTISTSFTSDEVVIEVADTGPGMTDEMMHRCFEPYSTTKDSGSGFGLSVVHGIVKSHDGRIEVDRPTEGGTVFRIFLPPATVTVTGSQPAPAARGLRILYIDEAETSPQPTSHLKKLGHEIDVANSGDSGLQKWRENEYDILVTDSPSTSVADLAVTVKTVTPDMPVVVLTESDRDEAAALLRGHAEPDAIVQKPFTLKEIEKVLKTVTDR